jgi:hypothetical protein
MALAAAVAVAVLHGAAVLFMLTGSLLALRRPRLLYLHAPVALAILAVNLAGQPCPLTDLELALRDAAGADAYSGGFLGHYVLAPFGVDVHAPAAQFGIYAVAVAPNVVGYGLHALRLLRAGRTTATDRGEAVPIG